LPLELYAHPFSSYSQKVLTALYEKDLAFAFHVLDHREPATLLKFERLWPIKRFPLLVDGDRVLAESTIIIEHLDRKYPAPQPLIPADPDAALKIRFLDRFFDNYVHMPMQKIVLDALRSPAERDPRGVAEARAALHTAYAWLERRLDARRWAAGEDFSLADCAAAPALFYADWVHPFADDRPRLRAYRSRLNARPSFARAIDGGRPYRALFPLGAPDRD
jgi:glutathione S-transferase